MGNSRLKFRAWDTDYNCMDYDFYIDSNGVIFEKASRTFNTPNIEIEENPNLIIMQFTGLHDKNGREIYEGDIVCITDYHDGDFYMDGVVKFGFNGYPAFEIYGRKNQTYSDEYNSMTNDDLSLEVIGNIHENTGLLDGLK